MLKETHVFASQHKKHMLLAAVMTSMVSAASFLALNWVDGSLVLYGVPLSYSCILAATSLHREGRHRDELVETFRLGALAACATGPILVVAMFAVAAIYYK